MSKLEWRNEYELECGGTTFRTSPWSDMVSESDEFRLAKEPLLVERYADLVDRLQPRKMIELGIFQGGSIAFFAELAKPQRLVAVELEQVPARALEEFIAAHELEDVVRPHYGVDQSDTAALNAIMSAEFGDEPIDLIIDDASHLLEPSRASFNVLFPRLRPGGLYIIEDWALSHLDMPWGEPGELPLTLLGIECVMVAGSRSDIVTGVEVDPYMIVVQRGGAELDQVGFDISACYNDASRELIPRR